jgi:hypothetical protein
MPALALDALLEAGLHGAQPLEAVSDPARAENAQSVRLAEGSQVSVALTAAVNGQPVQWTERRLVVRSVAHATRQAARLDQRLRQAVADIECLNERQQGKPRLSADQVHTAAAQVLQRRAVQGLVHVDVRTTSLTPLSGHTDTRVTGLLHLLTMALRVLTLLAFVVRRQVEQASHAVQGPVTHFLKPVPI